MARYVRIVPTSSWGGLPQYGLSEVQFSYLPTHASEPVPAPDAMITGLDFLLKWRPGRGGVQHDLHVGNNLDALRDGMGFAARLQDSQFDSDGLDLLYGETIYWKVDEINELAVPALIEGDIWSFSILDSFVVDDFEDYNNFSPNRPFQTWVDGLGFTADDFIGENLGNGSGAIVGHDIWSLDSPFFNGSLMEEDIVNGGSQSMPVYYDNSGIGGAAMYSEIERTWSLSQDWQRGAPDTLTLNVYGDPNNGAETLYVALEDSRGTSSKRIVSHPDPTVLQADSWQGWDIPLSDFGSVNLGSISKMVVGVGNPDSPRFGGSGIFFLDDVRVSKSGP